MDSPTYVPGFRNWAKVVVCVRGFVVSYIGFGSTHCSFSREYRNQVVCIRVLGSEGTVNADSERYNKSRTILFRSQKLIY